MATSFSALACFLLCCLSSAASTSKTQANEPVDINQATVKELMQVNGMTAPWAGRIVHYRPYRTKQDLVEQGIVSPQVYARIKNGIIAHRVAPAGMLPAKN